MQDEKTTDDGKIDSQEMEAFERLLHTARQCSAVLWGEREERDPDADSLRSMLTRTAMIYFLCRIDPQDVRTFLFTDDGALRVPHGRMPKRIKAGRSVLAEMFGLDGPGGSTH
ncbi:MAG: hypothetical protein KF914_20525 [Rhizobiaceae bacterium]|nr:hypothetical protein [Rhizobiaceae bacterium]